MVWSGLRGAVGLLLAVQVDTDQGITDDAYRTHVLFFTGGFAFMTLLINGTLTPLVLRACGLMVTPQEQETMRHGLSQRVKLSSQKKLKDELGSEDAGNIFA